MQNVGEIIEDKVPEEMTNIQTQAKQQKNDAVANKTSNNQQQKEATGNEQIRKKWKDQSIVIVNSKAKTTRPIILKPETKKR